MYYERTDSPDFLRDYQGPGIEVEDAAAVKDALATLTELNVRNPEGWVGAAFVVSSALKSTRDAAVQGGV